MIRLLQLLTLIIAFSGLTKVQATIYNSTKQNIWQRTESRNDSDANPNLVSGEARVLRAQNALDVVLHGARLTDAVLLRWAITNSEKAKSLTLQRSADGVSFTKLIDIRNKTAGYTDAQPLNAAWYRICIVTDKSEVIYSPTIYLVEEQDLLSDK